MHNHKVKGTLKTLKIANIRSKTNTKPYIVSYDLIKTYKNLYKPMKTYKNLWKTYGKPIKT